MKTLKHILRLIFATLLSILALQFVEFDTIFNILMFMGIYIGVSLILEVIFKPFEQKPKKYKNGNKRP